MTRTAGIPLVDLFDLADRINDALPQDVQDFIDQFAAVNHSVVRSDGAVFHHGSLRAIADAVEQIPTEFNIGIGKLSLPLLQTGIPFQLSFPRTAFTTNLEPAPAAWRLDLSLSVFVLTLEALEPALFVADAGATPRHLVRDPNRDEVRITGAAVLRIEKTGAGAGVNFRFIDQPDPLDPTATSGAVVELSVSPPHFFIGGSEFGLSVGTLQFDFSESYSPPNVLERSQGPGWQGVAIREATLYAPRNLPGIGDLSGGVKNVLIGSPAGLQGELEIQFGRTALDPAAFQFEQVTTTGDQSLSIGGSGQSRTVTVEAAQGSDVIVRAGFTTPAPPTDGSLPAGALQDWLGRWAWPDGTEDEGDATSGTVRHGQRLSVTPVELITVDSETEEFPHPEITFRFVAAGTATDINATIGSESFDNVTHLGGTAADVGTVQLAVASGATGEFEWQIEGRAEITRGSTFTPDVSGLSGNQTILLRQKVDEDDERLTRVRLMILDEGDLLVGCETGVFAATDDGTALDLAAVENTFDLSDFHAEGQFVSTLAQATLDTSDPSSITVPADGLAQVTIAAGPPAVLLRDRHVEILMDFDTDNETRWGEHRPAGVPGAGAFSQSDFLAWANRYPGAEFIVIGRCGDLGSASYNEDLANERATRAETLLTVLQSGQTGTSIDPALVVRRGEQTEFSSANVAGDGLEEDGEIDLSEAEKSEAVTNAVLENGWLIKAEHNRSDWPEQRVPGDASELIRERYRRVDIYAVGGAPTAETALVTDEPTLGASLRRSLVPADGRDPAPIPAGSPAIDYRVKLRIVWDSPTVSELKDAIPSLAEAEFAWTPQQAPLPAVNGSAVELSREVLTIFANWTHDARTGYTKAALGIKSEGDPDGLISTDNKPLTAALAFGPVLLSGVDADTDVVEAGARIAALLAAVGFAEADLGGGDTLIATGSKSALLSAALETEMRSISDPGPDMQVRVITDYVCTLHINGGFLGLKTVADQPMKLRYKKVGIEYDTSATGWERFGLVYDTTSLEIEDPGRWEINGVLGSLLRIVEVAVGRGSIWFEGRIAIALEIGVIEISEAIVRLTFHDGTPIPDFELRGLVIKADVPGTLEGEGRIRIEDDGVLRAAVDANIIPLGLGAQAGLAVGKPPEIDPSVFLELFLGVQFSTPLPLAQSGMAIYGFKGLFVMNGARKLPNNPDPVGRELEWWQAPPGFKYEPQKDQYAIGVGVVVGTMPDVSFCVSCSGMVVVAFPDPEVILGVDVKVIEVPDTTATDEGGSSGTITGLIVIDDEAVKLAVSAQYTIPKVLEIKIPFSGYFPYPSTPGDVYVRIGSDGQTAFGRFGEPVTLKLLPGTLDVRAWTYLMIEQGGLPSLGGDARFSFDGFSVGFGAGWEIKWSAGPIKLEASAKVLVGFGTAPLLIKGGVFVAGELDLVVVSISARGELILEAREDYIHLDGEFCGEVDLFFFSLSGCVGVSFGSTPDLTAPKPESPVKGISLTDRRDRIMGKAVEGEPQGAPIFPPDDPGAGAAVDDNHTVWPDTAPVIHFAHYVENAMGAGAQFTPGATPSQPKWWGSSGLKYTYRLDSVVLKRFGGAVVSGDEPLQSVWSSTPYRQPDSSGEDSPVPSEHEGPNLKLLDWNPWAWVVNMDNGGEGQDGDPVETVEDICDPKPVPRLACVYGRDARRAGINRIRLRQQTPAPGPYPSRFHVTGEPVIGVGASRITGRPLQTLVEQAGGHIVAGGIVPLPFAATVGGETLNRGYHLPAAFLARPQGLHRQTLPWEGLFDRRVTRPAVTLMICGFAGSEDEKPPGDDEHCVDFRGVKPGGELQRFDHEGVSMRPVNATDSVVLTDNVNQAATPATPGNDGSAEARIPGDGLEIQLPRPCGRVEVHVMLFSRSGLKGEAFAADGRRLSGDSVNGPERTPLVLRFAGDATAGVSTIRIFGGSNEAVVFKICCLDGAPEETPDDDCEDFRDLKPRDKTGPKLRHGDLAFAVINDDTRLRVTDQVDQRPTEPRPGRDGGGEIGFPDDGVVISLRRPCLAVDVHVMRFNRGPVKGAAFDARGQQLSVSTVAGRQPRPQVLSFAGARGRPIVEIRLAGGTGEAVIYRVCCRGAESTTECVDFKGLKLPEDRVARFQHRGLTFLSRGRVDDLSLTDRVKASARKAKPGSDDVPELLLPEKGVQIRLASPCDAVEISIMLFKKSPVVAVALDGSGVRVAKDKSNQKHEISQTLRLEGRDIRSINLRGGKGEAVIYRICCTGTGRPPRRPGALDLSTDGLRRLTELTQPPGLVVGPQDGNPGVVLPGRPTSTTAAVARPSFTVTGVIDGRPVDPWQPEVLDSREGGGRRCSLVRFTPTARATGPWNGFLITPSSDLSVTLVSVCGVDQIAVDARDDDVENQQDLHDALDDAIADDPDARREIVLEPGEEYEIEVTWSYQDFQPDDPDETPPDPVDSTAWKSGGTDKLRFKVARDATVADTPQDGLNEYIFDARDVGRYLIGVEPADGRGVQFTEDPIWAHFDNGHVEQLLDQYSRELQIEVRRTDPPPQSTPADLIAVLAPIPLTLQWYSLPTGLQPAGYARLNEAILASPCLSDGAPLGGASIAATGPLEPDADYDLRVLAPLGSGNDTPVVLATRFHTSRYPTPRAFIDALGYPSAHTGPYLPDDVIIPDGAAWPTGDFEESDSALDAALAAVDAETLPLPTQRARSYAFWRFDTARDRWVIEALLVDSFEPMKRLRTVVETGATVPSTGVRLEVTHASVGALRFELFRTNANWTRALLLPSSPLALDPAREAELVLHFDSSDGVMSGSRRLRGVPSLLEREGLA